MNNKRIIYICGLIGAGKTTILSKLEKYCKIILEPIDIISKYLLNPTNDNIVKLQYMFIYHHNRILDSFDKSNNSILVEGSPTDNMIYAKLSNMTKQQKIKYKVLYKKLMVRLEQYDVIKVYLDIDPITALKRIKLRGRTYEKKITKEYLNSLKYNQRKNEPDVVLLNYTKNQMISNMMCILEMLY